MPYDADGQVVSEHVLGDGSKAAGPWPWQAPSAHSATILITMPETRRPFLLILGDADRLAYVLREHRMAFTPRRRIPLTRGDIVFLYTTRGIFRNPGAGRGLIIGRAEIISDIVKFERRTENR